MPKYTPDKQRICAELGIELLVVDIDATVENREPDYKMTANLAAECQMPLCYGGGIKTVDQAVRIFTL